MTKKLFIHSLTLIFSLLCVRSFAQNAKYEVFVAGYNQKVPVSHFNGLMVAEKFSHGQMYNYYLTGFQTRESAEEAKAKAVSLGFNHARVEDIAEKASGCCYGYTPPVSISEDLRKIRNLFFDFDKANLKPEGISQLNLLAKIMKENPSYVVEVHAHTDAKGSDTYNENLANRRKDAAMNYLLKKGISKDRISGFYHGEVQPIAKNEVGDKDLPQGRQFNRRVELVVKEGNNILNIVEEIDVPAALK
ncbi:MAG: OmpA family protein [Bacteroidia bacterium]|nr:OmpA family protein [Bacteroidia bacterium]